MKKKNKERAVAKIKSSSWSHNPAARKDIQIKIKSNKPPLQSHVDKCGKHHVTEPSATDSDLSKDVYKEILDIVNVNSPNTLPFGKARMAHWVLSSKPCYTDEI